MTAAPPAPVPLVAAAPAALARHVAGLLDLSVLAPGRDEAAVADQPLLLVATAATATSVVEDGYVAALGTRLAGVVCWHVGGAALERLLGHLHARGVPAFVGVPERHLLDGVLGRAERAPHDGALADLALAARLAGVEAAMEAEGARDA